MILKDKIKNIMAKASYQHDEDQLWADIEAKLPPQPNHKRRFFLLFLAVLAVLSTYDIFNRPTYLHRLINNVSLASQALGENKDIMSNEHNDKSVVKPDNIYHSVPTETDIKNIQLSPNKQTKNVTHSTISTNISNKKTRPLILNYPPTADHKSKKTSGQSQQVVDEKSTSDEVALASLKTSIEISSSSTKEASSTLSKDNVPISNVFLCPILRPHVVYNRELELQQNLQTLTGQTTKTLWTMSVVSLVYSPRYSQFGDQEFISLKSSSETPDLSVSTQVMIGRQFNQWHIQSGLQFDAIHETIRYKKIAKTDEKISSDSARYYHLDDKNVYVPGSLNKIISQGKMYKVPNTITRWSVPVSLGYKLGLNDHWSIQPNIGLVYTFVQKFSGATFNTDRQFVYKDPNEFSKLYRNTNLWSYHLGTQVNYQWSPKLQLQGHLRYAADLSNVYKTDDHIIKYHYLGGGVGVKIEL
jgi:hypothetical protein